jgi:transcriptional regulator with XRE-family HTH domain
MNALLENFLNSKGITQADFARQMRVTQPTVSGWINHKISPSVNRLRKMSKITGISLNKLIAEYYPVN